MLRIRREQMKAFEHALLQPDSLMPWIKSTYPEQAKRLGDAGVKERIRKSTDIAERHGFGQTDTIRRFIQWMFLLDLDVLDDRSGRPWALNILGWEDATEVLKMAALEKGAEEARIAELQSGEQ